MNVYERIKTAKPRYQNESIRRLWTHKKQVPTLDGIVRTLDRPVSDAFLSLVYQYIQTLEQYDTLIQACIANIYNNRLGFIRIREHRKLLDGTIWFPTSGPGRMTITIRIGLGEYDLRVFKPILIDRQVKFLRDGDTAIDLVEESNCRAHFSDAYGEAIMNSITDMPREIAFLIADMISAKYDIDGYMTDLARNIYQRHALQATSSSLLLSSVSTGSQWEMSRHVRPNACVS